MVEIAAAPLPQPGARPRALERMVYFIEAGGIGCIKIGSAASPKQRLSSLQTGSPVPLRLLGCLPCGANDAEEIALHRQFAGARLHGEWFRPAPDLLAFIAEHARSEEAIRRERVDARGNLLLRIGL